MTIHESPLQAKEENMNDEEIPQTDSIQELAGFWDTHDLSDFEDQLEVVSEPVFVKQAVVRIPLPAEDVFAVKQLAKSQGIPYTDLIRRWVQEKILASR
jgi:predicted DNA binding CopG/RHH family protein